MQIIKKFDKQANYIFIAAFLIHLVIMCVEFGAWSVPFRGRLLQLAFGLCGIKILMTYYEKYEWIAMIILGLVGTMSYVVTKEKYVLYVTVLIFAAKSVDMKIVLKLLLYATLLATIVIAILSLCGIGGPSSLTLEFRPGTIATRYCLGFSHPNNLHGTFWYIISLAILLYKDKFDWKCYLLLTVINVLLFCVTDSKAGIGVAQLMIFAGVIYRYYPKMFAEKKYVYILGMLVFALVLILTLVSINYCTWNDNYGPIMRKLDAITSGRMSIGYDDARMSWWRLWHGYRRTDKIVDNGFASLGNELGYVVWGVYLAFTAFIMFATHKKHNGIMFAIIITCILYTFMESTYMLNYTYLLCNLSYVVAMMLLGKGNKT